ncbi:unnamed protein product [Protopolystoma xenopodis]|uniref:Uncharacterized protein n=1 Tax=Protopolystoma xenopodis TaxID=117903 RepID=A0A3S5FFS4_9PLAT|nr:unnamed protein product [Protopolystoma xenopodis]
MLALGLAQAAERHQRYTALRLLTPEKPSLTATSGSSPGPSIPSSSDVDRWPQPANELSPGSSCILSSVPSPQTPTLTVSTHFVEAEPSVNSQLSLASPVKLDIAASACGTELCDFLTPSKQQNQPVRTGILRNFWTPKNQNRVSFAADPVVCLISPLKPLSVSIRLASAQNSTSLHATSPMTGLFSLQRFDAESDSGADLLTRLESRLTSRSDQPTRGLFCSLASNEAPTASILTSATADQNKVFGWLSARPSIGKSTLVDRHKTEDEIICPVGDLEDTIKRQHESHRGASDQGSLGTKEPMINDSLGSSDPHPSLPESVPKSCPNSTHRDINLLESTPPSGSGMHRRKSPSPQRLRGAPLLFLSPQDRARSKLSFRQNFNNPSISYASSVPTSSLSLSSSSRPNDDISSHSHSLGDSIPSSESYSPCDVEDTGSSTSRSYKDEPTLIGCSSRPIEDDKSDRNDTTPYDIKIAATSDYQRKNTPAAARTVAQRGDKHDAVPSPTSVPPDSRPDNKANVSRRRRYSLALPRGTTSRKSARRVTSRTMATTQDTLADDGKIGDSVDLGGYLQL